jgi:diguanylate cyclase (GGDEF)-like protein
MVDADAFKDYNDQYGHPAGDRCLQELGGCPYDILPANGRGGALWW